MKVLLCLFVSLMSASAAVALPAQLSENNQVLNTVRANQIYQVLVRLERAKDNTGDVGENSMRAVLISSTCSEFCVNRYLILREFFQGHSDFNYNMTVLVDMDDSYKISTVINVGLAN